MIINQWHTSHVNRVNEEPHIESDSKHYNIIINGNIMASVEDKKTADILTSKLIEFNERYRRDIDTFDIIKELELIQNNANATKLGSYFS